MRVRVRSDADMIARAAAAAAATLHAYLHTLYPGITISLEHHYLPIFPFRSKDFVSLNII